MIGDEEVTQAAEALLRVERTRERIAPFSTTIPDIDVADAYRISRVVTEARIAQGDEIHGHKIGLTSEAAQRMAGIHEPDYGTIHRSTMRSAGDPIHMDGLFSPFAEPEWGFVLKERLAGPGVTAAAVWRATEYVVPCVEIVDSRFNAVVKLADSIADNASTGLVVVGGTRIEPDEARILGSGATLRTNNEVVVSGQATAVMGNPAVAVAWLANKLSGLGIDLKPGHFVLSGSITAFTSFGLDDQVEADFGEFGTVGFRVQANDIVKNRARAKGRCDES